MTVQTSTKVCSFGRQVVEKLEVRYVVINSQTQTQWRNATIWGPRHFFRSGPPLAFSLFVGGPPTGEGSSEGSRHQTQQQPHRYASAQAEQKTFMKFEINKSSQVAFNQKVTSAQSYNTKDTTQYNIMSSMSSIYNVCTEHNKHMHELVELEIAQAWAEEKD